MAARRLTWSIAVAIGFATLWLALAPRSVRTAESPGAGSSSQDPGTLFKLAGTNSCSARGCHGGIHPASGPLLNEYTTWITRDKHADAYRVLFNPRSRQIAANLHIENADKVGGSEDKRCLACHATPLAAGGSEKAYHDMLADGVSCEACHGAAEKWVAAHTTARWKGLDAKAKAAEGMRPLLDLGERAQVCAGCHVGAPESKSPVRDVNHDLIAAGHPRLNFEFGAYQANMPRHWNLAKESGEPYEFEAWAVGQVASAKVALELLEYRANADNKRPWPEFTEYDCYACHHDLSATKPAPLFLSARQTKEHYAGRTPGSLPWGTWYYSPMLDRALKTQKADADRKGFPALRADMQKPYPDRAKVAGAASQGAGQLGGWLAAKSSFSGDALSKLRPELLSTGLKEADSAGNWDQTVQLYLALMALNQDKDASKRDPAVKAKAEELAKLLDFKPGYDSPKDYPSPAKTP